MNLSTPTFNHVIRFCAQDCARDILDAKTLPLKQAIAKHAFAQGRCYYRLVGVYLHAAATAQAFASRWKS